MQPLENALRTNLQPPVITPPPPIPFSDFSKSAFRELEADKEKYDAEAARPVDEQLLSGNVAGPLLCSNAYEYPPEFVTLQDEPFQWGKVDPEREVHCITADTVIDHKESEEDLPRAELAYDDCRDVYTWDCSDVSEGAVSVFPSPYADYDVRVRHHLSSLAEKGGTWPLGTEPSAPAKHGSASARARALRACLDDNLPLLSIKGPPGTGKTDLLAEVALELARRDKKVGIVAVAHAAVDNALHRIAELRGAAEDPTLAKAHKNGTALHNVLGGPFRSLKPRPDIWATTIATAIGFINDELEFRYGDCDVLLLDEAGQIPAYTAAALSPMAPRMILFGDEAQLPAIFHGDHPPGSHGDSSAMAYLRDVLPKASLALEVSHRMNKEICGLIQRHFYPDIPNLKAGKNKEAILFENGKPFPPLIRDDFPHKHPRLSRSTEEAKRVVRWVQRLLKMQVRLCEGPDASLVTRPMKTTDIAILTPFRAQVRAIEAALAEAAAPDGSKIPSGIRVGSVDKMQGQGAAVVIYSLASSSPDYIAAQAEWLFSPNRWNVAISRAIACAIVVGDIKAHLSAMPNALDGLAAQASIQGLLEDAEWEDREP